MRSFAIMNFFIQYDKCKHSLVNRQQQIVVIVFSNINDVHEQN